jgi:hypothetical protein
MAVMAAAAFRTLWGIDRIGAVNEFAAARMQQTLSTFASYRHVTGGGPELQAVMDQFVQAQAIGLGTQTLGLTAIAAEQIAAAAARPFEFDRSASHDSGNFVRRLLGGG